jgi:hypothetical protein
MERQEAEWWQRLGVQFAPTAHGTVEVFWGGEWKAEAADLEIAVRRMRELLEEHLSKQPVHQGVYVGV